MSKIPNFSILSRFSRILSSLEISYSDILVWWLSIAITTGWGGLSISLRVRFPRGGIDLILKLEILKYGEWVSEWVCNGRVEWVLIWNLEREETNEWEGRQNVKVFFDYLLNYHKYILGFNIVFFKGFNIFLLIFFKELFLLIYNTRKRICQKKMRKRNKVVCLAI
jgi:hypothetical protein